jgi:hypothetical protein
MTDMYLYRYPFDEEGLHILTLAEAVAAMRELERQLNGMLGADWRWCDLIVEIIERHPTYVIYEIEHNGKDVGRAVVMPYCAEPPRIGPESTVYDRTLEEKIRTRNKPRGA